ncbi:MAG: hypothetical protein C5S38_04040 [Candidatus Methanophagaceae archaeon]|nr:MAG: hypothetical protein C5S38_04040 [Methanophagales archaeon]KAF5430470.1 hypothetical protein C5S36_12965 [Methanophagales archaeon]
MPRKGITTSSSSCYSGKALNEPMRIKQQEPGMVYEAAIRVVGGAE